MWSFCWEWILQATVGFDGADVFVKNVVIGDVVSENRDWFCMKECGVPYIHRQIC